MKRHIIGLAIFSFIVSAAVFIYGTFNNYRGEYPQTYPPIKTVRGDVRREITEGKINSPVIKQAVLSVGNGLFTFDIDCSAKPTRLYLFFYKKDESGTKLIATEEFYQESSATCENGLSIYKSFDWAKEINYTANYYVIARTSDKGEKFSSRFDESLAIPVLMAKGSGLTID